MSRVYARALVALAGAAAAYWAWHRNQPVASRWPPGGWEPSTPPESPAEEPVPEPEPEAKAQPVAEVEPEPTADVDPVLVFANTADPAALEACGLKGAALRKVLAERPFASVEAMRATRGIGPKTLNHLESGAAA